LGALSVADELENSALSIISSETVGGISKIPETVSIITTGLAAVVAPVVFINEVGVVAVGAAVVNCVVDCEVAVVVDCEVEVVVVEVVVVVVVVVAVVVVVVGLSYVIRINIGVLVAC
jgi:hypothetical protein